MSDTRLPLPDELTAGQVLMEVIEYFEVLDSFSIVTHTAAPTEGFKSIVPACLMPALVHKFGEPDEFVGFTFLVEPGIKRCDYEKVRVALLSVRNTAKFNDDGSYRVHADYISNAERVLRDTPKHTIFD